MKQFLKIRRTDKKYIKMINQTEKGFELVITSDSVLNEIIEKINSYKINNDSVDIVWQMKFKHENYITYKNCVFSEPEINFFNSKGKEPVILGKKIKVACSGVQYYSNSHVYKNSKVKKSSHQYKDGNLLDRMLKVCQLNNKSE